MKGHWIAGLLGIASALTIGLSKPARQAQPPEVPNLPLHAERTSPSDLALSGDVPGSQAYSGMYVAHADLMKLPQVTSTVTDDANFPAKVELGGVSLLELMHTLHIPNKNTLVAAFCNDGYEAHYTEDYRAAHDPFLVLTIDGKAPALVKRNSEAGRYGPYLISHPKFVS